MTKKTMRMGRVISPIVTFGFVLSIWYFISYVVMNANRRSVALPAPHDVLSQGFFTWAHNRGIQPIFRAMLVTGRVAIIGLLIATILGLLIAIVMNFAKPLEWSLYPYAVIVQTLPILALVPIIKIWFGANLTSRTVACVLVAIFPIITNALFGLQSTDRSLHELFSLHKASKFTRLRKLEFPSALPAIFTGLRIAAGGSVIGAIVGDFFFRQGAIGIGRLIDNYQKEGRTTELFAAAIVSSLFGVAIFIGFGFLSKVAIRQWHDSATQVPL